MRGNWSQQDQLRCPNLNAVNHISMGLLCWIANSPVITPLLFFDFFWGNLTCNNFCTCLQFCACPPTFIEPRIRDNFQLLIRSPLSFIRIFNPCVLHIQRSHGIPQIFHMDNLFHCSNWNIFQRVN